MTKRRSYHKAPAPSTHYLHEYFENDDME